MSSSLSGRAARAALGLALLAGASALAVPAWAQVATFEDLAVGEAGQSFTDVNSGIRFQGLTYASERFTIGQTTSGTRPKATPGKYLSNNFTLADGNARLSSLFAFTMVLPRDVRSVSLDYIRHLTGTADATNVPRVNLDLFDAGGTRLATIARDVPYDAGGEMTLGFTRPTADVRSVRLYANSSRSPTLAPANLYAAVDNIVIPEPATLGLLVPLVIAGVAATTSLAMRRRRPA